LWLEVNYSLFHLSPAGWHLASLGLQAFVTVQVFWLGRRLTRSDSVAAISALLFAVHPVHIESVAWISGVTDPMVATFMLGATLLFINTLNRSGKAGSFAYCGSLACAALALLSKEIAIVLPLLLILTAVAVRPTRDWLRTSMFAAPFFLLTLAYLALRHFALHGFMHPKGGWVIGRFLVTLPSLIEFYIRQLVVPFWISPYADVYWVQVAGWRQFWVPLSLCCVAIIFAVFAYRANENKARAMALSAWIFLPLLPALYIRVFSPSELVHDRYLYVSSVGFSIVAALMARKLSEQIPASAVKIAGSTAIAVLAIATFRGELNWANEILLYKYAAEMAPHNDGAFINLGVAYLERGKVQDGITALNRAINLNPNSGLAFYDLGHVFLVSDRYAQAEPLFQRALLLDPAEEGWQEQFAEAELRLGKIGEAEEA